MANWELFVVCVYYKYVDDGYRSIYMMLIQFKYMTFMYQHHQLNSRIGRTHFATLHKDLE